MATSITQQQRDYLDSLVCERMSSNSENLWNVEGFCNYYNPQLVDTIQNEANDTALPIYDFGCTLLIQDIISLQANQSVFFNEFNVDEEV